MNCQTSSNWNVHCTNCFRKIVRKNLTLGSTLLWFGLPTLITKPIGHPSLAALGSPASRQVWDRNACSVRPSWPSLSFDVLFLWEYFSSRLKGARTNCLPSLKVERLFFQCSSWLNPIFLPGQNFPEQGTRRLGRLNVRASRTLTVVHNNTVLPRLTLWAEVSSLRFLERMLSLWRQTNFLGAIIVQDIVCSIVNHSNAGTEEFCLSLKWQR